MRTLITLLLLAVASTASAQKVRVENLPLPSRGPQPRVVGSFGTWGAGVRPRTLDLTMNNPEVHLLADTRLPQGALERRSNVGGVFFGIGYRPLRWLRVPEIRVFLGGGDLDTRWRPVDNDLEVSARRLLSVRLEAVAGVEYDLGP
ncbi:MAG: hypothetical protein AAGE52_28485, partial [Myxococcota bacterium]